MDRGLDTQNWKPSKQCKTTALLHSALQTLTSMSQSNLVWCVLLHCFSWVCIECCDYTFVNDGSPPSKAFARFITAHRTTSLAAVGACLSCRKQTTLIEDMRCKLASVMQQQWICWSNSMPWFVVLFLSFFLAKCPRLITNRGIQKVAWVSFFFFFFFFVLLHPLSWLIYVAPVPHRKAKSPRWCCFVAFLPCSALQIPWSDRWMIN